MVNIIHPTHGISYTLVITYIANIKFKLVRLKEFTHIILFLFITGEDTNFFNVGI
ncbi:hypothetical protein D3C85_1488110 [compost metagenome]